MNILSEYFWNVIIIAIISCVIWFHLSFPFLRVPRPPFSEIIWLLRHKEAMVGFISIFYQAFLRAIDWRIIDPTEPRGYPTPRSFSSQSVKCVAVQLNSIVADSASVKTADIDRIQSNPCLVLLLSFFLFIFIFGEIKKSNLNVIVTSWRTVDSLLNSLTSRNPS